MANFELPDLSEYKDKFTQNGFIDKVARVAKRAGVKFVYASLLLYYTLENPKVSIKDKAVIIGALGYLITPLDLMPDAIPIAGLSDDLAVLIYVLKKVWDEVNDEVQQKAKAKLAQWFDDDEMAEADNIFDGKDEAM